MAGRSEEIRLFEELWKGGYYEGDPLSPISGSGYAQMGFISILFAIYQACIGPYVNPDTVVLEIGPGRGAWTRTMLHAKEIWCLDVLSAEHNAFWQCVGEEHRPKTRYVQVSDFSCRELPGDHFDFLFSFGTFCHITWQGQCQYYKNLYPKMRPGAIGMVMFADFDKYNAAVRRYRSLRLQFQRVYGHLIVSDMFDIVRYVGAKALGRKAWFGYRKDWPVLDKKDTSLAPGKWYHAGTEETCRFLESVGWQVINRDVGLCPRDPIVHFRKPA